MPTDDVLDARAIETLARFVPRARRVAAQSLASDVQQLLKWAKGSWSGQALADRDEIKQMLMRQDVPPEEALESLAVRVRPMLLQQDPVYNAKVTKALGWIVRNGDEDLRQAVAVLRRNWTETEPGKEKLRGYSVSVRKGEAGETASATDSHLALGWLYGDTVHADPDALAGTEMFGVDGRFTAAVPLVCFAAAMTIGTLNIVLEMRRRGLLADLSDEPFTTPVIAETERPWMQVEVKTAAVGAEPPGAAGDPFTEEWEPLRLSHIGIDGTTP